MNWCDERYVRLYTRDTADFLALSFEAQGLLALILRKLDRSGVLELGKHGKRGVAIAIGHAARWNVVEPALEELLLDGCLVVDGNRLVMPNFLEAQEAVQSDRMRQAESRARRREVKGTNLTRLDAERTNLTGAREDSEPVNNDVTPRDDESRNVTESHAVSQPVTRGHAVSQTVTPSVLSRAVPSVLSRADTCAPTGAPLLFPVKAEPRFDFSSPYSRYPRKRSKDAGMAACEKLIRTPADFEALNRGVDAYADEVKRLRLTPDKQLHWSTFITSGRWRELAEEAASKPPPRLSLEERMASGELK